MANDKISAMTAAVAGDLVGSTTRIEVSSLYTTVPATLGCTLALLRTTMFAGGTGYTASDPLVCGTVTASGNVGINATLGAWESSWCVYQASRDAAFGGTNGGGVYAFMSSNAYATGSSAPTLATWKYTLTGSLATLYQQLAGVHYWYTAPSGTAGNTISWTSAVSIDTSGNLNALQNFSVTGTSTLTGNVGIGNVPASIASLWLRSTAHTGTAQYGIICETVATTAATGSYTALYASVNTAAGAYTMTAGYGVYIPAAVKGAGSTITTLYGLYIDNQTAGTTNYAIKCNGGRVALALPTSSAGLAAGDLWSNGGVVTVA